MIAMNRSKHFIFLAVLGLVMTGCTTTLGLAGNSWIGAPVDDFIVRGGAPDRSIELQDGRVAYTWSLGCEVTLITRQGVIENWSSTNCLSIHPVPGKWKR